MWFFGCQFSVLGFCTFVSIDCRRLRLSELLRDFGNEKAEPKHGIEGPEVYADREDDSVWDAASDTSSSSQSDENMYEAIRRCISTRDWVGPLIINIET